MMHFSNGRHHHHQHDHQQPPLRLLPEWQNYTGGALAAHVLDSIGDQRDKVTAGHMFVLAALDLALAVRLRPDQLWPEIAVLEHLGGLWTVGHGGYAYIEAFDRETIEWCARLAVWSINMHIIVPPERDRILREALDEIIGRVRPIVLSLTDFINIHLSNATIDGRMTYHEGVMQIMEGYNRNLIAEGGRDSGLLLALPW